jgi:hypothetical protein
MNADTGRRNAILHRDDAEHRHANSNERATTIDQRLSTLTRALGRQGDRRTAHSPETRAVVRTVLAFRRNGRRASGLAMYSCATKGRG